MDPKDRTYTRDEVRVIMLAWGGTNGAYEGGVQRFLDQIDDRLPVWTATHGQPLKDSP